MEDSFVSSLMKVGTNAKGAPPLGVVGALSRGPGARQAAEREQAGC